MDGLDTHTIFDPRAIGMHSSSVLEGRLPSRFNVGRVLGSRKLEVFFGRGLKTSCVLVDGHASGIAHTSFFVDRCASGVEKNWMCLLLLDVFQGSRNIDVFVAERVVAVSSKNIKLFWVAGRVSGESVSGALPSSFWSVLGIFGVPFRTRSLRGCPRNQSLEVSLAPLGDVAPPTTTKGIGAKKAIGGAIPAFRSWRVGSTDVGQKQAM